MLEIKLRIMEVFVKLTNSSGQSLTIWTNWKTISPSSANITYESFLVQAPFKINGLQSFSVPNNGGSILGHSFQR